MSSSYRPYIRLKLTALAALAAGAGALAVTSAVPASAADSFSCTNRSGGVAGARGTVYDIRAAHHDGYDRLVIGFPTTNSMPPYRITQQSSAHFTRDASGQDVALEGNAGLPWSSRTPTSSQAHRAISSPGCPRSVRWPT